VTRTVQIYRQPPNSAGNRPVGTMSLRSGAPRPMAPFLPVLQYANNPGGGVRWMLHFKTLLPGAPRSANPSVPLSPASAFPISVVAEETFWPSSSRGRVFWPFLPAAFACLFKPVKFNYALGAPPIRLLKGCNPFRSRLYLQGPAGTYTGGVKSLGHRAGRVWILPYSPEGRRQGPSEAKGRLFSAPLPL